MSTAYGVVDAHVHVWRPEYLPAALRRSWATGSVLRKGQDLDAVEAVLPRVSEGVRDHEGRHLTKALELAGIDRAVVMGVDYGPEEWAADAPVDDFMAELERTCAASAGQLVYNAGVDPRRPDAVDRARRHLASPHCVGIKFYPPAGFRMDDPRCLPLLDLLVETGKTAVVHVGYGRGMLHWGNSAPLHLAGVLADLPELRLVLAHSGYPAWWDECVALAAAHPRTYLELSLWQGDALAPGSDFTARLERAVRIAGSDRVLFASDTMFGEDLHGVEGLVAWRAYVERLPAATDGRIDEDAVEDILRRNAEEAFLGGRTPRSGTSEPEALQTRRTPA